jgi:hypothetical protein
MRNPVSMAVIGLENPPFDPISGGKVFYVFHLNEAKRAL